VRRLGLLLALVTMAAALAACGGGEGSSAVSYTATQLASGEKVSVDSLRGKPALLVSWATWCNECDKELAGLQAFANSPEAEGVHIVAVNLDAANVDEQIQAKIDRHGLSVDLWRDKRNDFKRTFGALGVPTTVLLDRDGKLAGTFPGAVGFDNADIVAALQATRVSS
jgi:peroxiredoxin